MRELTNLANAICELLTERRASSEDGASALMTVLFNFMIVQEGVSKQTAMAMFADIWDMVEQKHAEMRKEAPHYDA